MNREKLKPCPFCGSTDVFVDDEYGYHANSPYGIEVLCGNCTARIQFDDRLPTKEQAITAWNTRSTRPSRERIAEKLKEILPEIYCEVSPYAVDAFEIVPALPDGNGLQQNKLKQENGQELLDVIVDAIMAEGKNEKV